MTAEPAAAVHRAVVLPIDRDAAWAAVTDPGQLACWLADEVELDAREGGAARFAWDDGAARVGVVDEVAERRRLVLRWWTPRDDDGEAAGDRVGAADRDRAPEDESLVELALDEVEGGTRVSVYEVRTAVLARGDVAVAAAGTPSPWGPRMSALAACAVATWA